MEEQIMRVARADIMDDDHGAARIVIELTSQNMGQAAIYPVRPDKAYQLLCLFQVEYLNQAVGKPVKVIRNEPGGRIKALAALDCDPWIEVTVDAANS